MENPSDGLSEKMVGYEVKVRNRWLGEKAFIGKGQWVPKRKRKQASSRIEIICFGLCSEMGGKTMARKKKT